MNIHQNARTTPYSRGEMVRRELLCGQVAGALPGLERKVGVWTTNFTTIPLIVAQSDMIAFFPVSIARMYEKFANIKVLPNPVEVGKYNISMAWHPRIHEDPAYKWLRAQIVATSSESASGQ